MIPWDIMGWKERREIVMLGIGLLRVRVRVTHGAVKDEKKMEQVMSNAQIRPPCVQR